MISMGLCSHLGWAAMAPKATAMERKAVVRLLCFIFVFELEHTIRMEYENISKLAGISSQSIGIGFGMYGFYGEINGFI